jgi:hypothetical protein
MNYYPTKYTVEIETRNGKDWRTLIVRTTSPEAGEVEESSPAAKTSPLWQSISAKKADHDANGQRIHEVQVQSIRFTDL